MGELDLGQGTKIPHDKEQRSCVPHLRPDNKFAINYYYFLMKQTQETGVRSHVRKPQCTDFSNRQNSIKLNSQLGSPWNTHEVFK